MNAIQRKRLSKRRRLFLSAAAACLLALLLAAGDSQRGDAARQDQQAWPHLDEELAEAVGRTAARVRDDDIPLAPAPAPQAKVRPLGAAPAGAASAPWSEQLADADDEPQPSDASHPVEPQTVRQTADQEAP
jgi:hypothetical protein